MNFKNIKNDFSGYFFTYLRNLRIKICSEITTIITEFLMILKKIEFGEKNKFFGIPLTSRFPESKITIGNKCRFRSDKYSNLFGINRKCIISTLNKNSEIKIGNNCGFSGTSITSSSKIEIGNSVLIGANTTITDTDWHSLNPENRQESVKSLPIKIEDKVFIGANSVILKGVRIGKNSIIGAGSIVTQEIPENVIAAGNPCKIIKNL